MNVKGIALLLLLMLPQKPFKQTQLGYPRVRSAFDEKQALVKNLFVEAKLKYDGFNMFVRAFKKEALLEVWIRAIDSDQFKLLRSYDICSASGLPGPKRKQGDLQVPEGVYSITVFNPASNFHLSLGLNYPNASDRILSDRINPGGDIYIHGNCVTVGCIPLTDDKIKEVYLLAVEARNNGQQKIPVHVFPCRMDSPELGALAIEFPQHKKFWDNLRPIYQDFEKTGKLKSVSVNAAGEYSIH